MKIGMFVTLLAVVAAIDNGKGVTPPMGWRSWNLYGRNVNQELIESQMDAIADKKYAVDGKMMSLRDLGYVDVGLDDNWQKCGSYGPGKYTYHDANGNPVVNAALFPNMKAMTAHAHSKNLTAGWYGNNCICKDHCKTTACYEGDAKALVDFDFDSVKLDGCGEERDLTLFASLYKKAGKSIMIENCHWGQTIPNATWCPFNFYRSSGDIRASYASVVSNLQTTVHLAQQNLSTPGCWAYPDMLEVGCAHGPGGKNDPGLSFAEARSHFGAWCIVSSPLTLSHDMNNETITKAIWPIISNTEAIAVNQAYAGESGTVFDQALDMVELGDVIEATSAPKWQQFYKPVSSTQIAVLVMNHDSSAHAITVDFKKIPSATGSSFKMRDMWAHSDLGTKTGSWTTPSLAAHDSAFVLLTAA